MNEKLEVGATYRVTSGRFGTCTGKVVSVDPEWATIHITEGRLVGLSSIWETGDEKSLRRSDCTFFPHTPTPTAKGKKR